MKYFLQILCFAFLCGLYLSDTTPYLFVPANAPPPPQCPPNEMFKMCLSNCSNCEQRGMCYLRECKHNGCDCISHFVRLAPGGPCVPASLCPKPQCDENEIFRECGPICERCGTMNCRMVHCEHRCYCKEGYKRDAQEKCIPQEECPPQARCARDEEMRDSGPEDEYCLHAEDEIISNATVNTTQCYCKEGFKRNGLGHCIPEKYCPIVKCLGLETYQACPRKCNVTCRSYGDPDCVEDGHCHPGCFCPDGFLMNDYRICVELEQCPQGSNPFVPTLPPQVETTIATSVKSSDDLQQEEATTPSTDGEEEEDDKPDEDIETSESTKDSSTDDSKIKSSEIEDDSEEKK